MAIVISSAVFLFFLDRVTKEIVIISFYNKKIDILGKWLRVELFKNSGVAFSIDLPNLIILPVIVIIISLLIYYFIKFIKQGFGLRESALIFIIAGALGNLYDRLRYGYVIDYINLRFWPVFNISDIMISAGVLLIGWYLFREKKK